MNNPLFSKDNEYFSDNEEFIKLDYCKDKGEVCNSQMKLINGNMLLSRKFIEKKEYTQALQELKKAYYTTFEIKPDHCQKCALLFRDTLLRSLKEIITDLKKMTSGLFARKNYRFDLQEAEKLLLELEENKS
jgi:hypothetical protein